MSGRRWNTKARSSPQEPCAYCWPPAGPRSAAPACRPREPPTRPPRPRPRRHHRRPPRRQHRSLLRPRRHSPSPSTPTGTTVVAAVSTSTGVPATGTVTFALDGSPLGAAPVTANQATRRHPRGPAGRRAHRRRRLRPGQRRAVVTTPQPPPTFTAAKSRFLDHCIGGQGLHPLRRPGNVRDHRAGAAGTVPGPT